MSYSPDTIQGVIEFCEREGQPHDSLLALLKEQAEDREDPYEGSDLGIEVDKRENGFHVTLFNGDNLIASVTGADADALESALRAIDDIMYSPASGAKNIIGTAQAWLEEANAA